MKRKFRVGDRVRVISHTHPFILFGSIGDITFGNLVTETTGENVYCISVINSSLESTYTIPESYIELDMEYYRNEKLNKLGI